MRRRKKKKEPRQKLILVTLVICVIILTILGIFVVFCPMPKPSMTSILGERQNEDGRVDFSNGDYVFTPDKDSIAYDEDNCVIFFNNQLIVYTFSEMSDKHISELAEVVNGDVVGRLSGSINALQIRVKPSSFDELNSMADQLMAHDDVLYAGYDYPIQMFTDEVGNDAKAESMADSNPWSSDPSHPDQNRGEEHHPAGNDWWAEAIGAYTAWQYSDQCQPIEVGIVDNGFDTNHDDLAGHITFLPDYSGNTIEDHGTAVAGIIGARNNEIGIRGVADSADLVCVDWDPYSSEITYLSTGEYIEMIKQLAENGVKVINNSWGNCFLSFKSIRNKIYKNWNLFPIKYFLKKEEASLKKAGTYDSYLKFEETHGKRTALECTIMMIQLMLNDNKDFLIVQSAGNGLDNSGPGVDATNNAHFCAIDNNIYNLLNETVRSRLAQRKIDYNSIDERILIVGAVEKEFDSTGYKMTQYSNFGPTVDICAPGGYKDIFSTLAGNKYDYLYGTSMAAPMVTGSAAFIWSLNPDLTAPEVRNILLTNTISQAHGVGNGSEYTYPMLNVGTAAKAACVPENNGGSYVGYHGKTYYWKLSPDTHQDAVTFDGVTFNDPVESTKNELICRDADGTESTLVTGPVYSTKIYICNGKIFYRSHQYQVESIKLNGDGGPVECAEGYIEGVDYDNNLLAVSNSTSYAHTLVNAAMGATLASADKNIYFIGEEAGTVTYAIPDSTNTIIGIYQVKTDGTKSRQIAKIETGYAAKDMQLLGIEVGGTINGSNIYVSYVKVGGSYLEKFDGGLTRIDANTGESHNLVDFNSPYSLTNTDIYCVQHSDGSSAIYFIGGEGSYNSYMHPWADAKNTYYIKTSTGEVKQSTQPFIPDGSYALVNREIVMRQEGKDQMNVVMTSDELDMTGYTGDCDLSERNTGIDISSIDMVGNTFFVELVQSHRDVSQDVGWRPAQVFDSLTAYKREPGGNLTQFWSIPHSDNKSDSDISADQQETDVDFTLRKPNTNLNRYDERDVFNDLRIKYNLTEGDVFAEIEYTGDDIDKDEFMLTDNTHLKLGDKFTVTLNGEDDISEFLNQHGFLPKIWSKTYTVDSLPKYVTTASDISDKALETIKKQSLDVLNAQIDSYSDNFAMGNDTQYLGMYILTWDGVSGNEILAVYTCTVECLDGSYPDAKVYIPIAFTDVVVCGNEVSNLESGYSPYHFRLERIDHTDYASIDGFSDGVEMYETISHLLGGAGFEYCNCEVSGDALAEFGD